MKSIEKHIDKDKNILDQPTTNPQKRRQKEKEMQEKQEYIRL